MDEAAGDDDGFHRAVRRTDQLQDPGFDRDQYPGPQARLEPYQDDGYDQLELDYGDDQFESDHGDDQLELDYGDDHLELDHGEEPLVEDRNDASLEPELRPLPKVLVVDRKGDLSLELVKAAQGMDRAPELLRLNRPTQLVEVVSEENPHVIVVAPAEVTQAGFRRLAEVHQIDPRIVILLSDHGKALSAVQTAESGITGILPADPTMQQLRLRLTRALMTAEGNRQEELAETGGVPPEEADIGVEDVPPAPLKAALPAPVVERTPEAAIPDAPSPLLPLPAPTPEPSTEEVFSPAPELTFPAPAQDIAHGGAFAPSPAPEEPDSSKTGLARIFSVTSASGGSGKTFLAINLATYLVKATGGKVLLIDLDLQFGEIVVSLQLRPQGTIAELLQEEDLVSALPEYLVDDRSGFKVLSAPRDPLDGERIGAKETAALLDAARGEFDFIVIDTPSTLNETSLTAFDQSEVLVLLANMDLPSLKHMRLFIQTLEQLQTRAGEISLILNKVASGTGIDLQEVEAIYPKRFIAVLPYAKEVLHSTNFGVPVLQNDPHAEISRKLAEGFMKLVPPAQGVNMPWHPAAASRFRFPRLLRGKRR